MSASFDPSVGSIADAAVSQEPKQSKLTRAQASRLNGARSRGPATAEGKAISSRNAIKHGFCSNSILLSGESVADLAALAAEVREDLQPCGAVQSALCERVVGLMWKLRRFQRVETAIIEARATEPAAGQGVAGLAAWLLEEDSLLRNLQRYETQMERSLLRCLAEIRTLQAQAQRNPRVRLAERERSVSPDRVAGVPEINRPSAPEPARALSGSFCISDPACMEPAGQEARTISGSSGAESVARSAIPFSNGQDGHPNERSEEGSREGKAVGAVEIPRRCAPRDDGGGAARGSGSFSAGAVAPACESGLGSSRKGRSPRLDRAGDQALDQFAGTRL